MSYNKNDNLSPSSGADRPTLNHELNELLVPPIKITRSAKVGSAVRSFGGRYLQLGHDPVRCHFLFDGDPLEIGIRKYNDQLNAVYFDQA